MAKPAVNTILKLLLFYFKMIIYILDLSSKLSTSNYFNFKIKTERKKNAKISCINVI